MLLSTADLAESAIRLNSVKQDSPPTSAVPEGDVLLMEVNMMTDSV